VEKGFCSARPSFSDAGRGPGSKREALAAYDSQHRKRIELDFDAEMGYLSRGGHDYPASPLRILRVWERGDTTDQLRERDLSAEPILLKPPRW
jgi:hypothetical protein